MPEFAWSWVFLLLPLPWLAAWLLPEAAMLSALRLPQQGLDIEDGAAVRQRHMPWWWLLVWVLLLTAAARPQLLGPTLDLPRSGRAMMLAIDLSGSMQTVDMRLGGRPASRFEATRAIINDFIQRRGGDALGLIEFGSRAYLVTPLTFDLTTVRAQLDSSVVGLAGRKTAIGDAIAVGVRRLMDLPQQARVLILLTDGVDNASAVAPLEAARIAKAAGVRVYTIGVGSDGSNGGFFGGLMATRGADLDAGVLTRIAESTGGHFYRASDTEQLAAAWQAIERLEPVKREAPPMRPREELFRWPLAAALLLVLLGGLGRVVRRRGEAAA